MDDTQIVELKAKVIRLEERNVRLQEDLQRMERDKRISETEVFRLQKDISKLKSEMEHLKTPPLIMGTFREFCGGKALVKSSTGPDFLVGVSDNVDRKMLTNGSRVVLNKQSLGVIDVLPMVVDPIVMSAEISEKPDVTYDDVGGLDEQLIELREAVEDPLLRPEIYVKVGIDPPKGVLLVGPPGTGKTLMAKAVANATNATFIRLVGSELVQKFIGEGARLVRELFELAKEKAPSIIFLDELDSIGAARSDSSTSGDREVQRTLMQLLAELDGFNVLGDIKIIGATNRPDILDEALLRPGRFDRIIEIGIPNLEGRISIFKIQMSNLNVKDDVDPAKLALDTDGMSGAEIKNMCMEAGMLAIRDNRDIITNEDFDAARIKVDKIARNKDTAVPAYMFG